MQHITVFYQPSLTPQGQNQAANQNSNLGETKFSWKHYPSTSLSPDYYPSESVTYIIVTCKQVSAIYRQSPKMLQSTELWQNLMNQTNKANQDN